MELMEDGTTIERNGDREESAAIWSAGVATAL